MSRFTGNLYSKPGFSHWVGEAAQQVSMTAAKPKNPCLTPGTSHLGRELTPESCPMI